MNPICCNYISSLDVECMDYIYHPCGAFTDNTWVGGTSNNWFDAANWSLGVVPDSCDNVFIPDTMNVFIPNDTIARAGTMQVDSSAMFETQDSAVLNVSRY